MKNFCCCRLLTLSPLGFGSVSAVPDTFHLHLQVVLACKGKVLFTGVGKSGFIAQKITQTLVSTGTKAVFLHPVDALHGDIGIVNEDDVLVCFSKSGATEELVRLVPFAKVHCCPLLLCCPSCSPLSTGKCCKPPPHICNPYLYDLFQALLDCKHASLAGEITPQPAQLWTLGSHIKFLSAGQGRPPGERHFHCWEQVGPDL